MNVRWIIFTTNRSANDENLALDRSGTLVSKGIVKNKKRKTQRQSIQLRGRQAQRAKQEETFAELMSVVPRTGNI